MPRICSRCKKKLAGSMFYNNRYAHRERACKTCLRAYQRAYSARKRSTRIDSETFELIEKKTYNEPSAYNTVGLSAHNEHTHSKTKRIKIKKLVLPTIKEILRLRKKGSNEYEMIHRRNK